MQMKYCCWSLVLGAVLLLSGAAVASERGLSAADAARWLDGYKAAWEMRDADRAAALFTEDATYQENPYEAPFQGRMGIHEYWSGVTADQRDVEFSYEVLTTYGQTAVAHWTATFRSASTGARISLDGIFLLEFDEDGLCSSLREWWHLQVNEQVGE